MSTKNNATRCYYVYLHSLSGINGNRKGDSDIGKYPDYMTTKKSGTLFLAWIFHFITGAGISVWERTDPFDGSRGRTKEIFSRRYAPLGVYQE